MKRIVLSLVLLAAAAGSAAAAPSGENARLLRFPHLQGPGAAGKLVACNKR